MSLNLLDEAKSYCEKGIEQSSSTEDLKKLAKQIDNLKSEQERREAEVSKAIAAAKVYNSHSLEWEKQCISSS